MKKRKNREEEDRKILTYRTALAEKRNDDMTRTCKDCTAFLIYDGEEVGSCHLHPPIVYENGTMFPAVNPLAWCLDWQRKDANMNDPQAEARAIDKYITTPGSRDLMVSIINWLDLKEKDPKRWPGLETIIATALAARERETWEKVIEKGVDRGFDQIPGIVQEHQFMSWCREQAAKGGGPNG